MEPNRFLDVNLCMALVFEVATNNRNRRVSLTSPWGSLKPLRLELLDRVSILFLPKPGEVGDNGDPRFGLRCIKTVARFSHWASLSCSSPFSLFICGRFDGILVEVAVEFRRSRWSNCDSLVSRGWDGGDPRDSDGALERLNGFSDRRREEELGGDTSRCVFWWW